MRVYDNDTRAARLAAQSRTVEAREFRVLLTLYPRARVALLVYRYDMYSAPTTAGTASSDDAATRRSRPTLLNIIAFSPPVTNQSCTVVCAVAPRYSARAASKNPHIYNYIVSTVARRLRG